MKDCSYPNCETTAGCRGACHEARRETNRPAELIQLADWIRDGKLTFVHCFRLGACDASVEQHDRIEAALRLAAQQDGAALREAAEAVCWFDWSDNDSDAVAAIERLRALLPAHEQNRST